MLDAGDPHVGQADLAVAVRGIVVAEYGERPHDLDPGRVHGHDDESMLLVPFLVGIGLAHDEQDLAARIPNATDPPLVAVDNVVIAVPEDRRLQIRGIG